MVPNYIQPIDKTGR